MARNLRGGPKIQYACKMDSIILGMPPIAGYTYVWRNLITRQDVSTTSFYRYKSNYTKMYVISLTVTDTNGCKSADTITIHTKDTAIAPVIIGENCVKVSNKPQKYYVNNPASGTTHLWNVTGGKIISGQNSDTVEVEWQQEGNGSIAVQETNKTCNPSASRIIYILKDTVTLITGDTFVCHGSTIKYKTPYVMGMLYEWRSSGAVISGTFNESTIYWGFTGKNYVELLEKTPTCTSVTRINVFVKELPKAGFLASHDTVCIGIPVNFSNTSTLNHKNLWSFGDGKSDTTSAAVHTFQKAGKYRVKLNVFSDIGCQDTFSSFLYVEDLPDAAFSVKHIAERKYTFTPENIELGSYLWDFGDGQTSTAILPEHTFALNGNYTVKLLVKNNQGCINQSDTSLQVLVTSIFNNELNNSAKSYFNKEQQTLHIQIPDNLQEKFTFVLYAADGRQIIAESRNILVGENNLTFNLAGLNLVSGIYVVKVYSRSLSHHAKFIY